MTGSPAQGAGTDELRDVILAAISRQHGCDTLLHTSGLPCIRCRQSVDALLSDRVAQTLADQRARYERIAAEARRDGIEAGRGDMDRLTRDAAAEALELAAGGMSFRAAEEESEGREIAAAVLDEESGRLYRRAASLRASSREETQ